MTGKLRLLGAWLLLVSSPGCGEKAPVAKTLYEDAPGVQAFLNSDGLEKSHLSPYVRGKAVVIDRTGRGVQKAAQMLLPDTLRAVTCGEVETVVWVDWSTSRVPGVAYTHKGRGYYAVVWEADLTVVDWKQKLILGGPRLSGPPPTKQILQISVETVNAADGVPGERPFQMIADYVADTARSIGVPEASGPRR